MIQSGAKLVHAPEAQQMPMVLSWIGVSMIVPWLALLVPANAATRSS